jgi:hypothetical protein
MKSLWNSLKDKLAIVICFIVLLSAVGIIKLIMFANERAVYFTALGQRWKEQSRVIKLTIVFILTAFGSLIYFLVKIIFH